MGNNTKKILIGASTLLIFGVSIVILYHQLRTYHVQDIISSLKIISARKLIVAVFCSATTYAGLCGFDFLAFRYLGLKLKPKNIIFSAYVSYAVSSITGYSMIFGGAVRYRLYKLYSKLHISWRVVAKLMLFTSLMIWVGLLAVGGLLFIVEPGVVAGAFHIADLSVRLTGIIFVSILFGYIILSKLKKSPITIHKFHFVVPAPDIALLQILFASSYWIFSALTLYVLLPASIPFHTFLAIYLPAQLFGIISQVPAGLGVFDTILILSFPKTHTSPQVLAALLAFRVIYYLIPFMAALALLAARSLISMRRAKRLV
jgi:uncharacterized membrane protein YbhN (UPF0104 family)